MRIVTYGIAIVLMLFVDGQAWFPGIMDTIETYWPNGQIKERYTEKTDTVNNLGPGKVGPYTSWYDSREIHTQGWYDNGYSHNWWTTFYRNGQLKEEGYYDFGKKHATWISWYEDGLRKEETFYMLGLRSGQHVLWEHTPIRRQAELLHYKNDELHGFCKWRGKDSATRQIAFYWHGNLLVPFLIDGVKQISRSAPGEHYSEEHGLWVEWSEGAGQFRVGKKTGDQKTGLWHIWTKFGEDAELY